MLWFWILTFAMILLGLWFIVPPMLSKKTPEIAGNDDLNVAIYRQKLIELERNDENFTEKQLIQTKLELEQSLLQDVGNKPETIAIYTLTAKTQKMVTAIVAVIVPVSALLLYAELSPPQWEQLVKYNPGDAIQTQSQSQSNMPSVDNMVAKLEARLQENPTDPKGWDLLGRSYFVMGRYNEAANAYSQASKLSNEKNADILANYAESVAMSNNRNMQGKPEQIIDRALAVQPNHAKSLWLAGTAALQAGKYNKAILHWQTLLDMHQDKSSEGAQTLLKQIAQARSYLGDKAAAPSVAQKPTNPVKGKTVVQVSVNLDSKLKSKASPDDTVFIFARAVQGPPMPLAIVKKQVKDLPITVSLNDAMAMVPDMTMSNFQQIYIGARVSKSGDATPKSGDLQGRSTPINTGKAQNIKITISQEIL